jgi:hypothetical protein
LPAWISFSCTPTLIGPALQRTTRELRCLVGADRLQQAAEPDRLLETLHDIRAPDAVACRDVDGLLGEVTDDFQDFQGSHLAEAVKDEVHPLGVVRRHGPQQRLPFDRDPTTLAATGQLQLGGAVQPPPALVIDRPAFAAHGNMQPALTKSRPLASQGDLSRR